MIDHTGIGVSDIARSATFYDAVLGALGMRRIMQMPDGKGTDGIGYGEAFPIFWIDRFHPHRVKQHTAFAAVSRAQVDAFHAAGLKAGGKDNGAPGYAIRKRASHPAITRLSSSIPTVTTWKPSSASASAALTVIRSRAAALP